MSQMNQTAEKVVYDALCNIFSNISPDTSKTRIRAYIQDHASDPELANIIQEYSLLNVKKTAVVLHKNNVFSSKAIAQEYFNATVQEVEDTPDTVPVDPAPAATETRLSAETRVPLSAQHHLLSKVQVELEAACFEFAKAKLPAVLDENDWNCAEAAELNLIARALGKHQDHLPGVAELPEGVTAGKILRAMENIRHAAVHREYLKAEDLLLMLMDSESLLILFKDESRLASLRSLREEVKKCVVKLDEDETNVKECIATTHEDAAMKIARLKQQEDEAVAQAEARRTAFHNLYAEQITAIVADSHVNEATQILHPSSRAAAAVLLLFGRFIKGTFLLVLNFAYGLYAMLAGFFV